MRHNIHKDVVKSSTVPVPSHCPQVPLQSLRLGEGLYEAGDSLQSTVISISSVYITHMRRKI